ncbi:MULTISPECIES: YwqG family protein [unclassified Streptomyces]|uniref:hypothetical protein n=1 Tax=Streptomyces sp. NPDC127129 TaxID=3345373 RepID=UPI003636562D
MTTLLLHGGATAPAASVSRAGGLPLVPEGFVWPLCAECGGAMQFIAHLDRGADVVSVFMCQNEPGMCEEWDPAAGGNRAYVFPTEGLLPATAPAVGETRLDKVSVLVARPVEAETYGEEDTFGPVDGKEVLGQLGGQPYWLQWDETPDCAGCGRGMAFVAQLDQVANFGGGYAYVFVCEGCSRAAFLWQC